MNNNEEFEKLDGSNKESAIYNLAEAISKCENNTKYIELSNFLEEIKKIAN